MSSENPYQSPLTTSPTAEVAAASDSRGQPVEDLYLAPRLARFLNMLIDQTILFGLYIAADAILLLGLDPQFTDFDLLLVNVVIFFTYYVFQEFLWGRTIGKFITGTVVVDTEGENPSLGQAFGRTASRLIPFEAFTFLFKPYPVGVHDGLAKTRT